MIITLTSVLAECKRESLDNCAKYLRHAKKEAAFHYFSIFGQTIPLSTVCTCFYIHVNS